MASDGNGKNVKEVKVSALDRCIQTAIGDGRTVGDDDDPARTKFPNVWEWMSKIYIGVDRMRQPATISITLGPTGVLVSINDRDLASNCSAACLHLEDAFIALERALSAPVAQIRSYGRKEPKLRKRSSG